MRHGSADTVQVYRAPGMLGRSGCSTLVRFTRGTNTATDLVLGAVGLGCITSKVPVANFVHCKLQQQPPQAGWSEGCQTDTCQGAEGAAWFACTNDCPSTANYGGCEQGAVQNQEVPADLVCQVWPCFCHLISITSAEVALKKVQELVVVSGSYTWVTYLRRRGGCKHQSAGELLQQFTRAAQARRCLPAKR